MSEENKNKKMKSSPRDTTKKITIAAIMAAISALCIIITNFTPLTFSLLMLASLCYYIAFIKCGISGGFLCIVASILISFFTSPLSAAFFMVIIFFVPYAVLAYFIRNFKFTVLVQALIRVAIVLSFAVIAYIALYFMAEGFFKIDLTKLIGTLGAAGFGAIFIVFVVIFDFMFNQLSIQICKYIK